MIGLNETELLIGISDRINVLLLGEIRFGGLGVPGLKLVEVRDVALVLEADLFAELLTGKVVEQDGALRFGGGGEGCEGLSDLGFSGLNLISALVLFSSEIGTRFLQLLVCREEDSVALFIRRVKTTNLVLSGSNRMGDLLCLEIGQGLRLISGQLGRAILVLAIEIEQLDLAVELCVQGGLALLLGLLELSDGGVHRIQIGARRRNVSGALAIREAY